MITDVCDPWFKKNIHVNNDNSFYYTNCVKNDLMMIVKTEKPNDETRICINNARRDG